MSQLFCRYCTLHWFSNLFLKSTLRAGLLKSGFYYSDYDDSVVESIFLLDYRDMMSLGCILLVDLAISIFNLLTGLLAH